MTIVFRRSLALALALAVPVVAPAGAATLQPDEAASKDVFVYEFDVPGFFGIPTAPRTTNLDTETLDQISPPPVPFGSFLGASETDPFSLTPGGPLREHGTRTLLQFDVASAGIAPDRVRKATLQLYALPALPAFEGPDKDHPVTTDLRAVTEAWGETEVTWDTRPSVTAAPYTSIAQSGVDKWVSFDITDLVISWLTNPAQNFGVQLSQRDVVALEQPGGERDRFFASLYASSAFGDPALRPRLEIAPVPVPPALGLLAAGVMALAGAGWRRRTA